MSEPFPCPCQNGKDYLACCGRYHQNRLVAPTAKALMQSRYSAYVLGDTAYLLASWHPSTRPPRLHLEADVQWLRLKLLSCEHGCEGDREGWVEFEAWFKQSGRAQRLKERSHFIQEDGRWFYVDGVIDQGGAAAKVGRNAPCPCGSGKKYKRCCG